MIYKDNIYTLKNNGYKHIIGFNRYMIKGSIVRNIARMKIMKIRSDGRINLSMNDNKRTCVKISRLMVINE